MDHHAFLSSALAASITKLINILDERDQELAESKTVIEQLKRDMAQKETENEELKRSLEGKSQTIESLNNTISTCKYHVVSSDTCQQFLEENSQEVSRGNTVIPEPSDLVKLKETIGELRNMYMTKHEESNKYRDWWLESKEVLRRYVSLGYVGAMIRARHMEKEISKRMDSEPRQYLIEVSNGYAHAARAEEDAYVVLKFPVLEFSARCYKDIYGITPDVVLRFAESSPPFTKILDLLNFRADLKTWDQEGIVSENGYNNNRVLLFINEIIRKAHPQNQFKSDADLDADENASKKYTELKEIQSKLSEAHHQYRRSLRSRRRIDIVGTIL